MVAEDIDELVVDADVVAEINLAGEDLIAEQRVEPAHRNRQPQRRRGVDDLGQRAGVVEDMDHGPRQQHHRVAIVDQRQVEAAAIFAPGRQRHRLEQADLDRNVGERARAGPRQPDHRQPPLAGVDDDDTVAEHQAVARPGKALEDQPGQRRRHEQPGQDLDHGDAVADDRVRGHVAVADRGDRLDRKEEAIEQRVRRQIVDRARQQGINRAEQQIDDDKGEADDGVERPPAHLHQFVINIARPPRCAVLDRIEAAERNSLLAVGAGHAGL